MTLCFCICVSVSYPEVIFDGTMNPEMTDLSLSGKIEIKSSYGKQYGNNLFHSFKTFNLDQNEVATFTGNKVNNIISRVTGGEKSIINGTIKSTIESADFFFINPSGIIFNESARLDIKGSFNASTANYLILPDSNKFKVNSEDPFLFTAEPEHFGFINQNDNKIEIKGPGKIKDYLILNDHQTLSFISSEITIKQSYISAPKGRINFVAGKANHPEGHISLSDNAYELSDNMKPSNIYISESIIDVDNNGSGNLYILGGDLMITKNTLFKARPGGEDSGNIDIFVNNIVMENSQIFTSIDTYGQKSSGIINICSLNIVHLINSKIKTHTKGIGNAGHISIDANTIILENGSELFSISKGTGKGGNISIRADNSIILSGTNHRNASSLMSFSSDKGNAGNVRISAKNISIRDGGMIITNTYNTGNAGDIAIQATDSLILTGYSPKGNKGYGFSSNISSEQVKKNENVQNYGKSGNIAIDTNNLIIRDGAQITNNTSGDGCSGIIDINASSIDISGYATEKESSETYYSGIYSRSSYQNYCDKPGGKITISSSNVTLRDHGTISTSTTGQRNAGNLHLTVSNLFLDHQSSLTSESSHTNNGGAAGKITISASDKIELKNNSTISTQATNIPKENAIDNSGKISITSNDYVYLVNSQITTSVKGGTGNGGNIEIAPKMMLLNKSNIAANAYEGNGGNIYIIAEQFIKSNDSKIEASSKKGIDGLVDIQAINSTDNYNFAPISDSYLNAESFVMDPCDKRTGEKISRLMMLKPEGLLPLFDDFLHIPIMMVSQPFETENQPDFNTINDKSLANIEKGFVKENILLWTQMLEGKNLNHMNTLQLKIFLSCAYKQIGYYKKARSILSDIQHDVDRLKSLYVQSLFYNCMGDINLLNNAIFDAMESFDKTFDKANIINNKLLQAISRNNYANVLSVYGKYSDAISYYQEAITISESDKHISSHYVKAISYMNIAHLYSIKKNFNNAVSALKAALSEIHALNNNYQKAFCFISLSAITDTIISKHQDDKLYNMAMKALQSAKTIAISIHNNYLLSYIFGYMGKLNESTSNFLQAIKYTKKAINISAYYVFPESLYLWQWQLGRLQLSKKNFNLSIKIYNKALKTLIPIRSQIYKASRYKKIIFQNKIKKVFFSIIETNLKQLNKEKDNQALLQEIRETMDLLKQTQLENFYKDECIIPKNKVFDTVNIDQYSAVVYPIILSDQLITLLIMDKSIKLYRIPCNDNLSSMIQNFGRTLRSEYLDRRYEQYAATLYDILIRPLEMDLIENEITTLIFSPDGILHVLPFSALYDGNQFLIEKFAIAIIPSIHLTDLEKFSSNYDQKVLLAGLSQEASPPLPGVKKELHHIKSLIGDGKLLLDQDFTKTNIEYELNYNDYTSIIFATHGQFGCNPENSFLNVYKGKLMLNTLEYLMNISVFRQKTIELLTLSACETAMGNEEIALGLSGIALKAGVKSVLATMWSVHDDVTYLFIKDFYAQLMSPNKSKVKAVQKAQIKLISNKNFKHPHYWCPYILIGNWY